MMRVPLSALCTGEALGIKPEKLSVQPWFAGMQVPDEVYAHLLSAYKIRIDDAYAAAGVVRGPLKFQSVDPSYEYYQWCNPETDFRLFLARGAARGALPPWWTAAHADRLMTAGSVLGNPLHRGTDPAPEEPFDFITSAHDRADGIGTVAQLRAIGDAIEGPPPWGTWDRGARDEIEMRPTLRRKDESRETATICHRCRGDARDIFARGYGPGDIDCPYCGYQGVCPSCPSRSAIERGRCTGCGFRPTLYRALHTYGHAIPSPESFDHANSSYARIGCALAAQLDEQPALVLYPVGDGVRVCTVEAEAQQRAEGGANTNDHLAESTDPELLTLMEAARMFQAGATILARALGLVEGVRLDSVGAIAAAESADAAGALMTSRIEYAVARVAKSRNGRQGLIDLKAGVQLLVDAYLTDSRCVPTDTKATIVLVLGMTEGVLDRVGRVGPNGGRVYGDGFESTASFFMFVCRSLTKRALNTFSEETRAVLEKLIERRGLNSWAKAGRTGPAMDRIRAHLMHAQLLHFRSHDKLTRSGEVASGYADLDAAIALSPFTMERSSHGLASSEPIRIPEIESKRSLRAPKYLSDGRLSEARADLEAVTRSDVSPDAAHLHSNLYALAAIHLRERRVAEGRECYDRARDAETRHVHLFGRPVSNEGASASGTQPLPAAAPLPALEFYKEIATAAFSSPEGEPLAALELDVAGLPPDQVAAFADALNALSLSELQ